MPAAARLPPLIRRVPEGQHRSMWAEQSIGYVQRMMPMAGPAGSATIPTRTGLKLNVAVAPQHVAGQIKAAISGHGRMHVKVVRVFWSRGTSRSIGEVR